MKNGDTGWPLHFILEAENTGRKLVWRADPLSSSIAVPIGQWFIMDYYFKEGNAETGLFYLSIASDGGTRRVVYDVHNYTHGTVYPARDGFSAIIP